MSKHLRFIGACLCLLFSMTMQAEKGPYGIFSEKDTTLTVYYGDIPEDAYRYDPTVPDNSDVWLTPPSGSPTNLGKLTKVRITKSFRDYKPTSLKKFFAYFTNFRTVEGINNMRTETVTDMSEMFSNCKSLKEIDLRSFNTSSVVSMRRMFYECRALTSVDLTTFNTSSVSDMYGMFWQSALETIDLSSFNTRQATNMGYMFFNMKSLKTVIVGSGWLLNSSSLDAENMFEYCGNIQGEKGTTYDESYIDHTYAHVDGGVDDPGYLTLKTQKKVPYAEGTYSNVKRGPYYPFGYDKLVIKYGYMPASSNAFELNCDGKTWWKNDVDSFFAYSETITIDPSMKEYPLTTTAHMFDNCTSVRYLKGLSNLNTDSVTDMSAMFKGCVSLGKYLDFKDFNTRNVTRMDSMFMDMGRFIAEDETGTSDPDKWKSFRYTLDLKNLDTRNVTSMEKMFFLLYWVDVLDISSFDTRKVTDMSNMFRDGNGYDGKTSCLKTIYVGDNWSTASLINTEAGIFGKELNGGNGGVSALFGGAGTYKDVLYDFYGYEVAHVDGGVENPGLFTSHNPKTFPVLYGVKNGSVFRIGYGIAPKSAYTNGSSWAWMCGSAEDEHDIDLYGNYILNPQKIYTVEIDSTVKKCSPKTLAMLFYDFKKLLKITGLEYLRTDSVRSLCQMFGYCNDLTSIDLRNFDTRQVTGVQGMFYDCESLKTIYVGGNWIMTDKAIQNYSIDMFYDCSKLVGGAGTKCKGGNATYAHIDGGPDNPGYLTEYKPIPYGVGKRCTEEGRERQYGDWGYGYDTLTIKYGIPREDEDAFEIICDGENWWKNDRDSFFVYSSDVIVDPSFREYPLKTTANMFRYKRGGGKIIGLQNLNTDSVTDMSGMFAYVYGEILDLHGLCTKNVTNMDSMFYENYVKIVLLDNFNTQNVTSMKDMFAKSDYKVLDISSFDTRNVKDMSGMFAECENLKTICVGEKWSTDALTDKSQSLFFGNYSLVGGMGTKFDGHSTSLYACVDKGESSPGYLTMYTDVPEKLYALSEGSNLHIYYGRNYASENCLLLQGPLYGSDSYKRWNYYVWRYFSDNSAILDDKDYGYELLIDNVVIDSSVKAYRTDTLNSLLSFKNVKHIEGLEYLVTDSVKDMGLMFWGCVYLESVDLSSFNTSSVKDITKMFERCFNLKTVNLSSFDTRNVSKIYNMFSDCKNLETVYVGHDWTLSNLTDSTVKVFENCPNLVGGAGTKWSSSAITSKYAHIDGGEENPGYFTMAKVDTFYIDGLKYIITSKGKHEASVGYADLAGDTIVIPEKVQIDGTDYTVTGIMDEGFINQFKLKSVVIPESVTKIGEKAFYENHNIISLDIPSSVSSIGASAFTSILNVAYAGNAEGGPWGANVLNGEVDYDLKYVFSDSTRTKIVRCFGHDSIIVIPNTVKELGRNSFAKIIELKSVDLNNVEKIDDKAFTYTGLQEISLSNKIKYIGERAFFNTYIKKILLPSSVDTMGSSAFSITDTVCCRWTTVPVGKQYHRGWNYKVNTVIYNCKLLNVSVENSDSSTVEVSGHVGIDAEGAYWYEDSASATIKAVPCKGYDFVQWSDNVKKNPRTFAMTADTAIAAEFKAKNYIITYKVDGKVYQKDTVACGDAITDIPTPKKEGYTFVGWDNLQESMPAGNVSVSAIFVVNNYTITYKVNGKVYQVDTVAYGDTIVTPKDPKQDNMVFDGWSELPTTMPAKNLIVIGSFSKKAYVLTYKVDGEVYQRDTITSGANITPAREPKKEGYTFSGWKNLPDTMPSKNLTVTGSYEINSYIITYWANNEIFQVDTVAYGDTIVAAKAAEKEGYTFGGWKDLPETMPAKNLTIRCSFEINYYTLTFMAGGEIFQQDSLMYGEYIYHPETPLRDGYNFIDWDSIPYFMPAKDVIVTAEYEAITYYIYYFVNDALYLVDSVSYGDSIVAIAYPEKEHYVFSGWSEMPATMPAGDLTIEGTLRGEPYVITYMVNDKVYYLDTVEYNSLVEPIEGPEIEGYSFFDWDDIPMYMPAKNVTVTAFLEVEYYTITYKVDDKVYQVDTLAYGDTIVAAKEPKELGLTFSGWSKLPVTMPAKDLIVTGTFSGESSYVITYKVDGKVYQRDTLIYGSTILAAEEPEKEGYTFSGWNNLPETMPSKNITVKGEFLVNSYHIYYLVDEELYKVDTVAYGDAIEVIANPKKEGYTFSGWSEIPATMPAEDLTVTGTFSGKSYVLTYKVDGKVYQRDTLTNGATIIAPEPEKEGYTFSGWNNLPATMPAKNVTVSGVFEVNIYTITYKVDDELYRVDTVAYGDTIVAAKAPKKSGLTFSGWSKMPVTMPARDLIVAGTFSGESYVVTYKVDGKVYQRDTLIYGSTILAAEEPGKEGYTFSGWNNLPETMPSKNITVKGEFLVNSYHIYYLVDEELYKVDTVAYGDAIEVIANPKKEGYTFSGWSETPATMPAEDLTVTGTFSGKPYVITYKVDGKVYQRDTLTSGATIIAPEPEKEGYTFSGWKNLPETMPTKNLTVTGTFSINSYILTYIVDEEVYQTDTLHYGDTISAAEAPEKENFFFLEWKGLPETMPNEDLRVAAVYLPYSGVKENSNDAVCVWSSDRTIYIRVDRRASYVVYNMLGHIMGQGLAEAGDTQVSMPVQGVYQVVVDKRIYTVLVK